jgi:hypothetical protein
MIILHHYISSSNFADTRNSIKCTSAVLAKTHNIFVCIIVRGIDVISVVPCVNIKIDFFRLNIIIPVLYRSYSKMVVIFSLPVCVIIVSVLLQQSKSVSLYVKQVDFLVVGGKINLKKNHNSAKISRRTFKFSISHYFFMLIIMV